MDKDIIYTHTHTHTHGILLGHRKKNEIMPLAAACTDPEICILSEVNQRRTNT